jgi:hypothetical protein
VQLEADYKKVQTEYNNQNADYEKAFEKLVELESA